MNPHSRMVRNSGLSIHNNPPSYLDSSMPDFDKLDDIDRQNHHASTPPTAQLNQGQSSTYASRVPPPGIVNNVNNAGANNGGVVPGLPLQRLPLGALATKGTGGGAPMQRGGGLLGPIGGVDTMNLKPGAMGGPFVKQKLQQFTFRYDDTDTLMSELQEFFPYVEMNGLEEGMNSFHSSTPGCWTELPSSKKKHTVLSLLHALESSSPATRLIAAKKLFYLLQGCFGETMGEEEQLMNVCENARLFRNLDGVGVVLGGLRDGINRHDALADVLESYTQEAQKTDGAPEQMRRLEEVVVKIEELNAEVGVYLGILYFVVEVCRGDEEFGEELMALDPPLPVYLFKTVAGLREKTSQGFPVKKLLLLIWKTLLACLGGFTDVRRAVDLQRDLSDLTPLKRGFTKVTPTGVKQFKNDLSIKYPTFVSPITSQSLKCEKLAEAVEPIPIRSAYHSSVEEGLPRAFVSRIPSRPAQGLPVNPPAAGPANTQALPQAGTPAPSPPPTPPMKPKKQQYQTDQTRPFVFPFTRNSTAGSSKLVPRAIDEADNLYDQHIYVPLGLYQLYKTRDEFIREESGLGFGLGDLRSGLMGIEKSKDMYEDEEGFGSLEEGEADDEAWTAWKVEDWKLEEKEIEFERQGDSAGLRAIRYKRSSLKRLYRVEVIYRSILPYAQSVVVVLLKLLLATVTGNPAASQNPPPGSPLEEKTPIEQPEEKPMTLEEVDVARHREITSKAVSAVLILLLKWFKASHVLKFQHLSTLLIDSNCLLLVLKMFGLQELLSLIQSKHEKEDWNLFRYCYIHHSPDKEKDVRPVQNTRPPTTSRNADGEEMEMLNDFSWRNFFYAVNFVKILHQLTKGRPSRINLLVQYKSSQILKRMLRVPHPMLQLQILKVIKSQVPYCGRKWRHSNMKTITAIYLNCKPELRDEWLAATDMEGVMEESNSAETTLRTLVRFYHNKHYSSVLGHLGLEAISAAHRRSESLAAEGGSELLVSGSSIHQRSDSDVFPPNRTLVDLATSGEQDYNPDALMGAWMCDYEAVIESVLGAEGAHEAAREAFGPLSPVPRSPSKQENFNFSNVASRQNTTAWVRLEEILGARSGHHEDDISDSESVVSIGELGAEARLAFGDLDEVEEDPIKARQRRKSSGNENTWEHISPDLSLLPQSPTERARRRSSSSNSSPLRPLIPSTGDWLLSQPFEPEDDEELGPMPIQGGTEDELARGHMPADEVEAFYQV